MMKILEVNTERTWRGGERQTLYTAQSLLRAGLECELLVIGGSPLAHKAAREGIRVRCVRSRLGAWAFLARYGGRYDVIHAQTAKAHTAAVLTKPFHRRPVVLTRRVDFKPRGFLWPRLRHAFTDRTVVISGFIRRVMDAGGLRGAEVISSVVPERELDGNHAAFLRSRAAPPEKRAVITIAALDRFKDPFTMLEAVRLLSLERGDFVFLHFGTGPLMEGMRARIDAAGLGGVYKLMGFVDDVEDAFAFAEVFAMGSIKEGLCSSVLDAFVFGVPVASTDAGGLKETVGDRGLLVPAGDSAALAGAIGRLLDEPELCADLVRRGREHVRREAAPEAAGRKYVRIFESLRRGR